MTAEKEFLTEFKAYCNLKRYEFTGQNSAEKKEARQRCSLLYFDTIKSIIPPSQYRAFFNWLAVKDLWVVDVSKVQGYALQYKREKMAPPSSPTKKAEPEGPPAPRWLVRAYISHVTQAPEKYKPKTTDKLTLDIAFIKYCLECRGITIEQLKGRDGFLGGAIDLIDLSQIQINTDLTNVALGEQQEYEQKNADAGRQSDVQELVQSVSKRMDAVGDKFIKALSVKQPWANRIVSGEKTIETRTYNTDYRGALLICSSKKPAIDPAGMALAIVELVNCRLMTKEDEAAACCGLYDNAYSWVLKLTKKIHPFPVKGQLGIFQVELPEGVR